MLNIKFKRHLTELQISLPDLFGQPLPSSLSDEEHNHRGEQVENAVRHMITEFCAMRPFLSPKNGINILIYGKAIKSPTAIKFSLCEQTKKATGWDSISAKVFLADRNEYEPDLFDILPVRMD